MVEGEGRFNTEATSGSSSFLEAAESWHQGRLPTSPGPALAEAWRRALGDEEPASLERRLSWEVPAHGQHVHRPPPTDDGDWKKALDALRTALQDAEPPPPRRAETAGVKHQLPFVDLWWPATERALKALRAELEPGLTFAVADEAWDQLASGLLNRLCLVAAPTLYECFNRERGAGATLLARVAAPGDALSQPTHVVYRRFLGRHRRDGLESLLGEFPVLGRHLGTVWHLWRAATAEMLTRLAGDRAALARDDAWGLPATAPLTSIHQGLSDPHRGGRSVAILGFGSGVERRALVYKPRNMRLDEAFQAALQDLNQHGSLPPLRTLRVLARDGYGYMEHVAHRPCDDGEALHRFYRNAGRLTAVLHLLGGTDCHFENLIASGDQLLLIDAETLLEAEVGQHVHPSNSEAVEKSAQLTDLQKAVAVSALRTGMLPTWLFVGAENVADDSSALGVAPPREPTAVESGWRALNSDQMTRGRVRVQSQLPGSLPVGFGQPNPLAEHLDDLLEGFRAQADALLQRRDAWLSPGGVLERFTGLSRRLVMRPSYIYFALQRQQLMPSALTSSGAQGLVLEQLARAFLRSAIRPRHWPVFTAEVRQMEQLDIPLFVHPTDGDALPLSGMEPVERFIEVTGLEACRARLRALDEGEITFQCRLMRGAVRARQLRADSEVQGERPAAPGVRGAAPPQGTAERPPLLDASERKDRSKRIALELKSLSIIARDGTPDWLGLDLGPDADKFCFGPVGPNLYGGSAGVALLQAALAATGAGQECHTPGILGPLARLGERGPAELARWFRASLGVSGAGGVLLALLELDRLGAPPPGRWSSHRALALRLLEGLGEPRILGDTSLDVMGGVAGLIGPLLRLADGRATAWAVRAGDHLLARQLEGGGWPRADKPDSGPRLRPLTGFSHGAAGMAAALGVLHFHTGEARFLEGCRRALCYERASFDPGRRNWPDFRASEENPGFAAAWCHGAPGIALARLCLSRTQLADERLGDELEAALLTTSLATPETEHLCCGAMGLVAILRAAGGRLGSAQWKDAADQKEAEVLRRSEQAGGQFRMFNTREGGVLLPGFFTGLSGIGLVLLHSRLADACVARILSAGLLVDEPAPSSGSPSHRGEE